MLTGRPRNGKGARRGAGATIGRMITLVVPIRDEPAGWWDNFAAAAEQFEIVIADGGGAATPPSGFGGRVISLPGRSRGARFDAAARAAPGDGLFFLHGDSRPPADARARIEAALAGGAPAGCFRLAYRNAGPALRWIAWWANLRTRWMKLPFGDQGIFCTPEAYAATGGFRDLPICDDVDFVLRLRRLPGFRVLSAFCETSPRRYRGRTFRQVLTNWRVLAGYFAGVPPDVLQRWYRE